MKKFLPVLLLLTACGVDDAGTDLGPDSGVPNILVDSQGAVWNKVGPASFTTNGEMLARQREAAYTAVRADFDAQKIDAETFDRSMDAIAFGSFPIVNSDSIVNEPQTTEQIAENLRGVTLINGHEYISEPNYDLAAKIAVALQGKVSEPSVDDTEEVSGSNVVDKTKCCGNDDRFTTTVASDYARIMLNEVGCSLGVISANVGITAAHCLYDTEANAWLTAKHTSVDPGGVPWFRRETSVNYIGQTLACYRATVPSCWTSATSNSSVTCDYAVVDFSVSAGGSACADTTPFGTWNGVDLPTDAEYEAAGTWGMGYPAYVNTSGGSINSSLTFMYTRLNSTWGYDTIVDGVPYFAPQGGVGTNDASGVMFLNKADAQEGDSGRPHLDYITSGNYQVGIHVGNYADGSYNIDRRIDSTVWSFITANSPL